MKRSLLIVCILTFSLMVCGCTYNTTKGTIASDKYVAILEVYTNQSTLIGTPPYITVHPIPIPTPVPMLDFDNSQGVTKRYLQDYGVAVNDSFKVFLFQESFTDTPTTWGFLGMSVRGVYGLPYVADEGFTIVNVTGNGTVMATFGDRSIILKPGENTTIVVSGGNTTGAYLANINGNNTYDFMNTTAMPWPVQNERIYTFTNEGIFNKSRLDSSYVK